MPTTPYTALGIMSGSSLDGIDLAVCRFDIDPGLPRPVMEWSIEAAATVPYPEVWKDRLINAVDLNANEFWRLHADLGDFIGHRSRDFLAGHPTLDPTLVGCHGHTVFHEPRSGYSVQLGEGSRVAHHLGLPVVTELRAADIAAGGQGAPLAPVADRHLFPETPAFLNLGGIANFSLRLGGDRLIAGDVSGCCQILDRLARREGLPYDKDGQLARSGSFLPVLGEQLDALPFHGAAYPKSLSNEWVVRTLWPVMEHHKATTADLLHTFTGWLADKVISDLRMVQELLGGDAGAKKILVSGGGARNTYLVEQLSRCCKTAGPPFTIAVATGLTGDFKEAALIALCAVFRHLNIPNSLSAATGADYDTVNGALYAP